MLNLLVAAGIIAGLIGLLVVVRLVLSYRVGKKALNGELGEKNQWTAELIFDGDEQFTGALETLSSIDKQEVIIEAETKQELRELTIERADE